MRIAGLPWPLLGTSIMGRDLFPQIPRFGGGGGGLDLLGQGAELSLQSVDLFLLAVNGEVEAVHQVFGQGQLDLDFGEAGVHRVVHAAGPVVSEGRIVPVCRAGAKPRRRRTRRERG